MKLYKYYEQKYKMFTKHRIDKINLQFLQQRLDYLYSLKKSFQQKFIH